MKVVVAPNAFKGSLSVLGVCRAMESGVLAHDAGAQVLCCPMSDGGDGLCDVMSYLHCALSSRECKVMDALGRPRKASFLWDEARKLAVIESARANGLAFLADAERDVLRATSYGVGQMIAEALDAGAKEIVIGAGGSASVDGGLGCLQSLGARVETTTCEASVLPGAYCRVRHVDLSAARDRVGETTLTVLSDVDVPLEDGWRIFAPQKGANDQDMQILESGLKALRDAFGADASRYWCGARGGAAGGLTAALSLLGACLHDGAAWVAEQTNLRSSLPGADLVLTGEGRFDATSLVGKAPGCVLEAGRALGVSVGVIAGEIDGAEAVRQSYPGILLSSLTDLVEVDDAMRQPARWIHEATRRVLANQARALPSK